MFLKEECYHVPDVIEDKFQAVQGQIARVARRGQDTSNHLAFMEYELKTSWVQVQLEQKYLRHLIKEHVFPLQSYKHSLACQCSIIGDFRASPIPALFRDLHSEVSSGHGDPPPLESVSSDTSSFVSCWDRFALVEAEVLSIKSQGGKEEVSYEEKVQHDVLGCSDCYVDPHNGHMTYCPLSMYNPFHPSHMCLAGAPCSCDRYLAGCELYL